MTLRRCQKGFGIGDIGPLVYNKPIYQKGGNFYPTYSYNTPIYYGSGFQCGAGIGSVFATLGRVLLPIIKQGFQSFKKQGLQTGIKLLNKVQEEPVKNYIINKSTDMLSSLAEKGIQKLKKMDGAGFKRKKKSATKSIKARTAKKFKHSIAAIKRSKLKKERLKDIFDSQ